MTWRDRKDSRRRTEGETRHPEFRNPRNDVARWAAGWPARALVVLGVVALGARDLAQSTEDRLRHERRAVAGNDKTRARGSGIRIMARLPNTNRTDTTDAAS